jgi:hypothetical protein
VSFYELSGVNDPMVALSRWWTQAIEPGSPLLHTYPPLDAAEQARRESLAHRLAGSSTTLWAFATGVYLGLAEDMQAHYQHHPHRRSDILSIDTDGSPHPILAKAAMHAQLNPEGLFPLHARGYVAVDSGSVAVKASFNANEPFQQVWPVSAGSRWPR